MIPTVNFEASSNSHQIELLFQTTKIKITILGLNDLPIRRRHVDQVQFTDESHSAVKPPAAVPNTNCD